MRREADHEQFNNDRTAAFLRRSKKDLVALNELVELNYLLLGAK